MGESKENEVELTPEEKKIDEVQNKLDEIADKVADEVRLIEKKYAPERDPLIKARSEAIAAIPGFWKKAVGNHFGLVALFSSADMELLDHLTDVHIEELLEEFDAFKLTLTFDDTNPFFTNTKIDKVYRFNKEKEVFEVEASKIDWKEGKNLAAINKKLEEEEDKLADEGKYNEDTEFSWFGEWEENEDEDEEDEGAGYIREDLWAQPFKFYSLKLVAEDVEEEGEAK